MSHSLTQTETQEEHDNCIYSCAVLCADLCRIAMEITRSYKRGTGEFVFRIGVEQQDGSVY